MPTEFWDNREMSFIVTGSARLDFYPKGGDSLQGRHHYYQLHPFSMPEINAEANISDFSLLFNFRNPICVAKKNSGEVAQRKASASHP
jgi:predicted AAA+ superfamily ATPase